MDAVSYKTISANEKIVKKEWVVVDAQEMVVGRLASQVARILKGKNKPYYTPHFDCGDNVIIINAEKGGQRFATPREVMRKDPRRILEHAIKGMLPKNRLGAQLFRNLHVYVGPNHPHEAQQPKVINIKDIK